MSYYAAPFTFDFAASLIQVDDAVVAVDVDDLYDAIKLAQASEEGILYGEIARGSGLVELSPGVMVGLTVQLVSPWQIRFGEGSYIAEISGGNLVGGPGGDPVAYSEGVQVVLNQSAASTAVNVDGGGTGPTAAEIAAAVWSYASRSVNGTQASRIEDLAKVHGLVTGVPLVVTETTRTAGDVSQTIEQAGATVTVERQ
jgi:hypothetical protein